MREASKTYDLVDLAKSAGVSLSTVYLRIKEIEEIEGEKRAPTMQELLQWKQIKKKLKK